MRGIFISYRREDTEGQAGRLFDDLSAHFGRDAVFMDVAGIKKGLDFRRVIDEHVASCGVLLVIIGKRWLSVTDSKGKRRLDDPNDFVRLETAAALSRDIPVVPVLVHGADMPKEPDLPAPLKELAFRNGTELTHARWDSDVKLLIEDLRPYLEAAAVGPAAKPTREQPSVAAAHPAPQREDRPAGRSLRAAGAAVVVGGALAFGYHHWQDRSDSQIRRVAAVQAVPAIEEQRVAGNTAATPPVAVRPEPAATAEPSKHDAAAAQAEAARAAAEKAAAEAAAARAAAARTAAARAAAERATAARREAEERRRREETERLAQLAEEQRKRDEEARKIALERAEKERLAAEQAAAARIFADFAAAVIGGRQNQRR